ncbi:TIGR02391 family protein [Microbacterium sp. AK009]|uniref:TIGR02391 family protein n=1 Tax=Microbacterium sp. AK009 TaxID=2723068 RepID=UPI00211C730C|nr:TIGR02391 family protein [Microbacterium sp. AK009]
MKPEVAVVELKKLKEQAVEDPLVQASTPQHKEWKAKVVAVLERSLGADSSTVQQFKKLSYHVGFYSGAPGEAEKDARYFRGRVQDAAGLIEAAIYELELSVGAPAIEGGSYDSGLWDHVKHSVEEERWEQVASAAAIYVEDKVRRWAGNPTNQDGGKLIGQTLFAKAFGPGGVLALGSQRNETEGWRSLGTGMVAAISNVDRHNIQERADAKQYALGVLGLASLLLIQIRYEHADAITPAAGSR